MIFADELAEVHVVQSARGGVLATLPPCTHQTAAAEARGPEACVAAACARGQKICFLAALYIYKYIVYGFWVIWGKANKIYEEAKDPASYALVLPLKDCVEVIKVEMK